MADPLHPEDVDLLKTLLVPVEAAVEANAARPVYVYRGECGAWHIVPVPGFASWEDLCVCLPYIQEDFWRTLEGE